MVSEQTPLWYVFGLLAFANFIGQVVDFIPKRIHPKLDVLQIDLKRYECFRNDLREERAQSFILDTRNGTFDWRRRSQFGHCSRSGRRTIVFVDAIHEPRRHFSLGDVLIEGVVVVLLLLLRRKVRAKCR